jgi:prepilin-type N-terminal cleavage/methylation domain-containing protein
MNAPRSQAGFTLVEVLVAASLSVIVLGAVLSMLDVFQSHNRLMTLRNEAQDNARTVLDTLARELRNGAAPSSTTPGALEKAGKYSIVFQTISPSTAATGENKTHAIRVRYCLNRSSVANEVLWKQTKTWTTPKAPELPTSFECPDRSTADYDTAVQVAQYIVNANGGREEKLPLFTYVPSTWTSVSEITGVEPNVLMDVNPGQRYPGETQLKTAIDLRNENRPPTASFTAKVVGNHVVQLNGTQSTDPDGLSLSYKWFANGKKLSSTSSLVEEQFTAGSYVFELVVTTPSGLEASAKSAEISV